MSGTLEDFPTNVLPLNFFHFQRNFYAPKALYILALGIGVLVAGLFPSKEIYYIRNKRKRYAQDLHVPSRSGGGAAGVRRHRDGTGNERRQQPPAISIPKRKRKRDHCHLWLHSSHCQIYATRQEDRDYGHHAQKSGRIGRSYRRRRR